MHLLITGATGFIGSALVHHLKSEGHTITAWVRNVNEASRKLGTDVSLIGHNEPVTRIREALELSEGVVNLTGQRLAGVRWTRKRKMEFAESRIGLTETLVDQIRRCQSPPKTLISASAVGYYGNRGSTDLTENSRAGDGFASELCIDWERAALRAEKAGTRTCLLRLAGVIGHNGAMLKMLSIPFQLGIGIFAGNGRQYLPWIHLADVLHIIKFSLANSNVQGAINCAGPALITGREFAQELKKVTRAVAILPAPSFLLRLAFGEGAGILTNGQKVIPAKLTSLGFSFRYPNVTEALSQEFNRHRRLEHNFHGNK